MKGNRGYTLVELVVVMSIMAALLGLSMTALIRARRTQEIDALNERVLDFVRRARNSSISVEETARVYGVRFINNSGAESDSIELWRYPGGCSSSVDCNTATNLLQRIDLGADNISIESIVISNGVSTDTITDANGTSGPNAGEVGIYFSSPFGRGCTRLSPSPNGVIYGTSRGTPNSVTELIDKDYPIDFVNGGPVFQRFCNPDDTGGRPTTDWNITVTTVSNDATLTIRQGVRFNMYSGDVATT